MHLSVVDVTVRVLFRPRQQMLSCMRVPIYSDSTMSKSCFRIREKGHPAGKNGVIFPARILCLPAHVRDIPAHVRFFPVQNPHSLRTIRCPSR